MPRFPFAAAAIALLIAGCGTTPPAPEPVDTTTIPEVRARMPARPFPEETFYDLLVAEFAMRQNRYDLALGNYLQQAHETRDPQVAARATRLAQFMGADNAATDAARLWVELEPESLEARYTLATLLAKSEQPLAAMQQMSEVQQRGGETNFAAVAASALNAPPSTQQQLMAEFDQLLQQYPGEPRLMTGKALLLQQQGELEASLALIREVLDDNPQDLHAIIIEAKLLQQLEREDEAFARLEEVIQQFPDNRRLRLQYARLLLRSDLEQAREQFEILLRQTPQDAELILSLALLSKELGDRDAARDLFQRLLDTGERSTEAHYQLGILAEERGDFRTAIEHYREIPLNAESLGAAARVAQLLLEIDEPAEARSYLAQLREQHPGMAVRLYLLEAELLLELGAYKEGHQLLSEALALYPEHSGLLYSRSVFSEKRGDIALMEKDLRVMLEQNPDNPVALNALGYGLANLTDRYDEAYALIKRALELKPGDPAILDSLGWVEYRRGNYQQALALLERAYDEFPDPEVAAHLGEVLWQMGKRDTANAVWREALQREPDSRILLDTVKRLRGALYGSEGGGDS